MQDEDQKIGNYSIISYSKLSASLPIKCFGIYVFNI